MRSTGSKKVRERARVQGRRAKRAYFPGREGGTARALAGDMKLRAAWLTLSAVALACSGSQDESDAGTDASLDAPAMDVAVESATDAPLDAPGDGGVPSKCAGSSYRLCDGFEGASIDKSLWSTTLTKNATVQIDSTHVARGKSALWVHTGLGDAGDTAGTIGDLRTTHNFPFPNDDVWGRAFVYMANQSPDMHTNLIEAVGALPGDAGLSHYRIGVSTNHVIAGNYIPGDYADHSSTVMPLDQWNCFEWHFDGQKSEYHFYLDGNELTDMAILSDASPPWTAPPFDYVELGLHLYHDLTTIPTLDVWYDEVALDTSRIGCAN